MVGPRREGVLVRAKYYGGKKPKQPAEISEVLGAIIEKAAVGIDVRHGQMISDWESFAPDDWVTFGRPVGVRDGTLLVEVSDGSAATVLKYQIADLKAAIEERYGAGIVTSVRVKVEGR
jgi:predicted nucleic acid-binding Zn ribbon protein